MSKSTDHRAETPDWKWRAAVTTDDGQSHDVTRELAVMYDAIIGSLDWGSGFLDREDAEAILRIGGLCGFDAGAYEVKSGAAILVDTNGEPASGAPSYSFRNGYAEHCLGVNGEVVKLINVKPDRDATLGEVWFTTWSGEVQSKYPLPEPMPVKAGRGLTFEVPVTR